MKTVSEIKFDSVVKDCFTKLFKPIGFKKKGYNFYLRLEDVYQIVNFQKSSLYSKEHIVFTINIGLFIPEYWLIYFTYHDGQIPSFPPESMSAIRQRLGRLKSQSDEWFEVVEDTDIEQLVGELSTNVIKYILPYFKSTKTRKDILGLLDDNSIVLDKFTRLIIYGEYKDYYRAQAEYRRLKIDDFVMLKCREELHGYRDRYGLVE